MPYWHMLPTLSCKLQPPLLGELGSNRSKAGLTKAVLCVSHGKVCHYLTEGGLEDCPSWNCADDAMKRQQLNVEHGCSRRILV